MFPSPFFASVTEQPPIIRIQGIRSAILRTGLFDRDSATGGVREVLVGNLVHVAVGKQDVGGLVAMATRPRGRFFSPMCVPDCVPA